MANAPGFSLGGIVGVVVAVVLVGGIVATPFYLGALRADESALSAASSADVELIRRVVLNLDQQLSALADMDAALADGEKLTPEAADQIKAKQGDVFSEALSRSLNQTAQTLRDVESRDQKRHVAFAAGSQIQGALLSPAAAVAAVKKDYLNANSKLRQQAQAAIDKLKNLSRGKADVSGNIAATRIQATFYYIVGKLHGNRADFEQQQAGFFRYAALQRLATTAALQRELAALKAQSPAVAIDNIKQRIASMDGQLAEIEGKVSKFKPIVEQLTAERAKLERTSLEAREKMAELEAKGKAGVYADEARYAKLAATARKAEVEAAILWTGANSAQATPSETAEEESIEEAAPAAGMTRVGLRDLQFRLQQLEEDLAIAQSGQASLQKQQEDLQKQSKAIESQRSKAQAAVADSEKEVSDLLKQAAAHQEVAKKAAADASAAFKQAGTAVQAALRAAKQRTSNAVAKARSPGGTPNELMELVSKDGDTEASLLCLAGEIAYSAALLDVRQLQEVKDQAATAAIVGQLGTEAAAPAEDLQALREQAANKLAEAAKNYQDAEKLLGSVSVKTSAGSVSGSNYTWQVHVGQAAVQFLRACLSGVVEGTPDREAQDKAYELLTKATQGREQSPLLTTALDTLEYLQQTAK